MFFGKEKYLIGAGILFAIVFIVIVVATPVFKLSQNKEPVVPPGVGSGSAVNLEQNAFIPKNSGENQGQKTAPGNSAVVVPPQKQMTKEGVENLVTSTAALGNLKYTNPPPSPERVSEPGILDIEPVADSEIVVSTSGISSAVDYLDYKTNFGKDNFDYQKFNNVIKDGSGSIIKPIALIKDVLDQKRTIASIHQSLSIFRDYSVSKKYFLEKIAVYGNVISIHKKTIAFEKLMTDLIDKTFAVESGQAKLSELENIYNNFSTLGEIEHQNLFGAISLKEDHNDDSLAKFFSNLAKFFGLEKVAQALNLISTSFGGPIPPGPTVFVCDGGWLFEIDARYKPPPVEGAVFLSVACHLDIMCDNTLSFPIQTQCWLGNVTLAKPCFVGPAFIGNGSNMILGGSSLPGCKVGL